MKERPIIFDAESVRAILAGSKTQTRRVIKPQPGHRIYWNPIVYRGHGGWTDEHGMPVRCPYGKNGDRLWVREAHTFADVGFDRKPGTHDVSWSEAVWVDYRADEARQVVNVTLEQADYVESWIADREVDGDGDNWRSPLYMPRWASRITLEIVDLGAERLQEISGRDCVEEGCLIQSRLPDEDEFTFRGGFRNRWDAINARRGFGWDTDPWVWVIEFRRVTP